MGNHPLDTRWIVGITDHDMKLDLVRNRVSGWDAVGHQKKHAFPIACPLAPKFTSSRGCLWKHSLERHRERAMRCISLEYLKYYQSGSTVSLWPGHECDSPAVKARTSSPWLPMRYMSCKEVLVPYACISSTITFMYITIVTVGKEAARIGAHLTYWRTPGYRLLL